MAIAEHARLIRGLLDDIKAGRPINTSGDVQAALEAAVTSLSSPTTPQTALQPVTSAYPSSAAAVAGTPPINQISSAEHDAAAARAADATAARTPAASHSSSYDDEQPVSKSSSRK